MRHPFFISAATLALFLCLTISVALPGPADKSTANVVLLNDRPVGLEQLASARTGLISLAKADAGTGDQNRIRFFVYLKRAGKIVNAGAYPHNHSVLDYEMSVVLKEALSGDQLVIEPEDPAYKASKRVITLKNLLPPFQWIPALNANKKNC